ncbi:MAG: DUF58 domain-containing protein [Saccharofermentanales bacterium]
MTEVIQNKSLLPIPWLVCQTVINLGLEFKQLNDMHISGEYHRSVFSLMPFSRITRKHYIKCMKRGVYNLSHITLTTGDVFCFLTKEYGVDFDTSIMVYPEILSRQELLMHFHSLAGDMIIRRYILPDPFMISGVREYDYNDPMNMINWKTTARCGSLQVYNRDFTSDLRLMIILNIDPDPFYSYAISDADQRKIEYAISYCATLADYATENGFEVGFCTNSHFFENEETVFIYPHYSYEQFYEILESLSKLQLNSKISIGKMVDDKIDQFVDMDIIIISVWADEKINESIDSLKKNGCKVDLLIIPDFIEKEVRK